MKLFDFTDPFFAPIWIRVAVVVVTVGWGLNEFASGAPMWGCMFVGVGVVAAWRFATIDYSGQDNDTDADSK